MGFELDAIKHKPEHAQLRREVEKFSEERESVEALILSAKKLYLASAELLQFFDCVVEEKIENLMRRMQAFEKGVEEFKTELGAKEKALRERLASLRPLLKHRRYRDNFEWARNRFHLYWQNSMGLDPPGFEDAFRYMGEMGTTVLQVTLPSRGRYGKWNSREDYIQDLLRLAEREGIKIFCASVQE